MISNLDPASQLFLANVERIQERLANANRQVSSGKKISQPSDAPDQIDSLLQLHADQGRNTQIQSNLALALTDAQSADGALGSTLKLLDRARTLAAQGANSTMDATGRQSLAQETETLLDEMVAYSQTAVQGRYIFSGDRDDTAAYQADSTSPTGVTQVVSAAATIRIEDPAGGSFAAAQCAPDIFDHRDSAGAPAADNVFAALSGLQAALLANDPDTISQAGTSVQAAAIRLNSMQAFYGTVERRIQDAQAFAEKYATDLTKQLSQKEDADVTAAALELSQGGIQLQAAFQMRAAMPNKSLFEYIG